MSRPSAFLSTIVAPAPSYSLVDLASLKTLLGLTTVEFDPFLRLVIPQASTAAQTFTNNPFVVETILDQFFPGSDGWPWTVKARTSPLQLKRWPLIGLESVIETIAGVATTLTQDVDFLADPARGQLTRLDTYAAASSAPPTPIYWRTNPVAVQYQAGYTTIPGDVLDAVTIIVKGKLYARDRDPMVRQQNAPGVLEQSFFFGTGPGGEGDLPVDAQARLQRYRVPVFA